MSEVIGNQSQRIQALKSAILRLHQGQGADEVGKQLSDTIHGADPAAILAQEQRLLAEGGAVADLCAKGDLQHQLIRGILAQRPARPELPDGHPADTFRRENAALRRAVADVREILRSLVAEPEAGALLSRAQQAFHLLMDVDKHYRRKEKLLLPALAGHGLDHPMQCMTANDSEVLALLSRAAALFGRAGEVERSELVAAVEASLAALERMIDREDNILLPVALDMLTAEEWAGIGRGSSAFGWCLVQPG